MVKTFEQIVTEKIIKETMCGLVYFDERAIRNAVVEEIVKFEEML